MLRQAEVGLLVDVQTFPRSRTNPVFNIDLLPDDLALVQIGYRHAAIFRFMAGVIPPLPMLGRSLL